MGQTPTRILESQRQWRLDNPEAALAIRLRKEAKRRAARLAAGWVPRERSPLGTAKTGSVRTPEYQSYVHARDRCTNPKNAKYKNYGARGIEFRFTSFEQFLAVLGPRPIGTSIDRLNNDGHYEPGNVCWSTPTEQRNNQRSMKRPAQMLHIWYGT